MKEQVCFSAVDLDGMRFAEVPFFGVPASHYKNEDF